MSSFTKDHPFIYSFYCIICVLPFIISLPVITTDDPFDKFIDFLSNNNCSMPKEVELPFSATIDSVPFSYLSLPLNECKTAEAVSENKEANLLCREVFEVIQNITCIDYKLNNSKIDSGKLSNDVCHDFATMQDIIPKQKNLLSKKFEDGMICKLMCTGNFELLCKTLLWGYNTQAKLKNATLEKIAVTTQENVEVHPDSNEIPEEEITPDLQKLNKDASDSNAALNAKTKTSVDEKAKIESNRSVTEDKKKETENHEAKPDAIDSPTINSEKTDKSIKESKVILIPPKAESASESNNNLNGQNQGIKSEQDQGIKNEQNQDIKSEQGQSIKSEQEQSIKSEQSQNITKGKSNNVGETKVEVLSKSLSKNDKVDVPTIDVNISESDAKSDEKVDVAETPDVGEDNKVDVTNSKEKTKDVPNLAVPQTEEEKNLKKPDEENVKQGGVKETQIDLDSKGGDPKENEIPNGESDSNVAEPAVPSIFPDKSDDFEPQPELKDPEQYNTAFNPALKKETNVKNPLSDGSSQFPSGSNMHISNENYLPHESDDINRNFLPARNYLPDQEDSHFFFYFLTIVLVLMAGYLIFHNKQKIIALIVEGRHERRRRSHGAGYKKLETK